MSTELKPASGVLAKSLGFSLALALLFTLVANLLPQVEGEAPVEKEIDLGALTIESFAALGESIFTGKGTCALCHNALGRAPDILALNMVATTDERLKDERYQGKASDAESYFRESMLEPGLYVVKGFGKKGSNDTESPMPAVHKPPIELTDIEINAVIAYLQAKDGNDVTVPLPTEAPAGEVESIETAGPAGTVEEVVAKFGCQACHKVFGSGGDLGPSLDQLGDYLNPEQIRQSIIDPNAVIAEGYPPGVMPSDFAEQMMVKELEMLVAALGGGEKKPATISETATNETVSIKIEEVFTQFGCQACHKILGSGGELGPSLETVGARSNPDQIRQSIIEPNAKITEGYPSGVMPPNFVEQMSAEQLDVLVVFLSAQKD